MIIEYESASAEIRITIFNTNTNQLRESPVGPCSRGPARKDVAVARLVCARDRSYRNVVHKEICYRDIVRAPSYVRKSWTSGQIKKPSIICVTDADSDRGIPVG